MMEAQIGWMHALTTAHSLTTINPTHRQDEPKRRTYFCCRRRRRKQQQQATTKS